jgi:hypothetical protein
MCLAYKLLAAAVALLAAGHTLQLAAFASAVVLFLNYIHDTYILPRSSR